MTTPNQFPVGARVRVAEYARTAQSTPVYFGIETEGVVEAKYPGDDKQNVRVRALNEQGSSMSQVVSPHHLELLDVAVDPKDDDASPETVTVQAMTIAWKLLEFDRLARIVEEDTPEADQELLDLHLELARAIEKGI